MNKVIEQMLSEYDCKSAGDYENALKEIMQELALLGLWRSKFFEHALFYGGTALRILYNCPRFSEDMDFSLLKPNSSFKLNKYFNAIENELSSYGFSVEITTKNKNINSQIESAFIKGGTKINIINISTPAEFSSSIHSNKILKIKLEVDVNPPMFFKEEIRNIYSPIPFQVKTMTLPSLFSGKIHAVLMRNWETRVKGRDFFDYLWYLGKKTKVDLKHLNARLAQDYPSLNINTKANLKKILTEKFENLNIEQAKKDVRPFLKETDRDSLELWSNSYFIDSLEYLDVC